MKIRTVFVFFLYAFNCSASGWWHVLYEDRFVPATSYCQMIRWTVDTVAGPPHTGTTPNQWYLANFIRRGEDSNVSSIAGQCYALETNNPEDGLLYIAPEGYQCDSARLGAIYRDSCNNNTHKRISSGWINTQHCTVLRLEFDLILVGDQNVNDRLTVQYASSQSPTTWNTLNYTRQQFYCTGNVPKWSRAIIQVQAFSSIDSVRLGFVWKNNGDCIKGPYSVAIDNLVLYGMNDCPQIRIQGPESACTGTDVAFDNLSIPTGGYSSFQWSFGDGNTDIINYDHVTHQYNSSGDYSIELQITSPSGCALALQKAFHVFAAEPASLLHPDVLINGYPLSSTIPLNISINAGHYLSLANPVPSDIESIELRVGNYWGVLYNPGATFPFTLTTPGLYNIQITAINACGFTTAYFNGVLNAQ
jgi:hypothetical protein